MRWRPRGGGPEIGIGDNPKEQGQDCTADEEELSSRDYAASSESTWQYVGSHCRVRRILSSVFLEVWELPGLIAHNIYQH